MGNQIYTSSTTPVISLQEARAHISDEEWDRLHRAFARFKKSHISFDEFCYHVLGGAKVPEDKARELFGFCSRGSDYLSFDNLICSLVGICRVEQVQATFIEENQEFASWGLRPPLLSAQPHDTYISFYEVMSYVTHLTVDEVMELEKVFATVSDRTVCKMSREQWAIAAADCFPLQFTEHMFRVFDENGDGQVDFREMVCSLSAICRGPFPSRLSFLAKLWDLDGDGYLSEEELNSLYGDLNVPPSDRSITLSAADGKKAEMVDFATWAVGNDYAKNYYAMALELGHICFGLRPESRQVEHSVIGSFEMRVKDLPLPEWNIVSSEWHRQWEAAVATGRTVPPLDNQPITGDKKGDAGWSGKVACLSAESACLRADISNRDYVAVPPALWRAMLRWHGSLQSVDGQFTRRLLPAQFWEGGSGRSQLELFPLPVLLLRHDKKRPKDAHGIHNIAPWAYAQVSRAMRVGEMLFMCRSELRLGDGEARLWTVTGDAATTLLDDLDSTLFDLRLGDIKGAVKLLLELRDPGTGVWPEELRASVTGAQISAHTATVGRPGAVGLVNFGNFCYRNAAVQCLARVTPLTELLLKDEIREKVERLSVRNEDEAAARLTTSEYALLLREMWTAKKKNISPIDFNEAIRAFERGEQHDCQEFVAFLIEQLTSCLDTAEKEERKEQESGEAPKENGVEQGKEKEEQKEEEEDEPDEVKGERAWQTYLASSGSLPSQLFSGQLRSSLVCRACTHHSSVFEPFTSLSLPIGFDNVELFQVIVVRRDGSVPRRYGFRIPRDSTVQAFKSVIADASGIAAGRLTVQCLSNKASLGPEDANCLSDECSISRYPAGARLYALELPESTSPAIASPAHPHWRLAVHRKLQYNYEPYFLASTGGHIVSRFGIPLIVPCGEGVTGKQMYEDVARQMKRFMSCSSQQTASRAADPCEDASSGPPFQLSVVDASWEWCGQCPALRFCRGCPIFPDDKEAHAPLNTAVAVDWQPIALYLKYNHSQELACEDDPSVAATWQRHFAPSSLQSCLSKFSTPETLDALIACDKCKRNTHRDKNMEIWRLPKYLIVQLKRFEYIREEGRMGKCKRVVDFPLDGLDMAPFVADGHACEEGGRRQMYSCIAMANHYGQLSSGHFVAYARGGSDDKWLLLNDCSVREVSEEEVDKASAYLLFYEKREM